MKLPGPLVSIVVPAYNAARFLRLSLDSIVSQTYPNKEILLIDDASTDDTESIARSYGDQIRYHRQPRNRGQFPNVGDGIALARGEYISVYHADDIYSPEIVEREVAFLKKYPEAGAVFAMQLFIDAEGRENGRLHLAPDIPVGVPVPYESILNTLLRYKNCIFPAPSSMIRAEIYRKTGPYRGQEYPVAADFEMFFRIARDHQVGLLDEHLFRYRWGHGNADQMDRLLRTEPEPYFAIMDAHLAAGGLVLARADALAAHEAHRGEDAVMRGINCYIMKRPGEIPKILRETSPSRLLASPKVQRCRVTALYFTLLVLARFPHSHMAGRLFRRRWFGRVPDAVIDKAIRTRSAGTKSTA
ncbi:MAG TPA: glycosyltransferase [Bryobacteraceae bacterium]|jgi:glycosyltransferase involved in cell wall biosynthesis